MMETRKAHVEDLRAQISTDAYRVDPAAVADAIVRRLLAVWGPSAAAGDETDA